ncbi:MAG TPA: ATP-grasp domain-containing protein [Candidatus Dormibacteraeota bacterium]|nr:ATP-grasp domain-containing protein [Candidatus Dormibacteraeota bacterium]
MSVLVTDAGGNHALAVVRSLGRRGVRVVAADSRICAQAAFSRFCAARAVYPSPGRGIEAFLEGLCRILDAYRPDLLMPMTERTILAMTAARGEIESRVRVAPLPSPDALRVAFDKQATIGLAASLGIPVPRTVVLRDPSDLGALRSRLSYPAVIKPRRSECTTAGGRVVPGGPPEYCFRAGDLEAAYLSVHRRSPLPLIQEYIPGEGYGISALYDRGRLRALFAHRRLRMIRPTGSGSSLRESIAPPPDMVGAACALLEALRWHGVAMVEFKRDARDGVPKLMEINGRFWNSLPLAIASGVDFPFLLYTLARDGACPQCFEYRLGVRGRWLAGDVKHLAQVLRGRPAGWTDRYPSRLRTVLDFVKPAGKDLHYDDLWLSDPVPFFVALAGAGLRALPRRAGPRRLPSLEEAPHA